ncbi:hypothetical protein TNCV_1047181 [Trichonephila clavipes]|nr:hypothetical protein TNCV_1047181 [Trichonephila clavipes]
MWQASSMCIELWIPEYKTSSRRQEQYPKDKIHNAKKPLLPKMIAVGETWTRSNESELNRQSNEWRHQRLVTSTEMLTRAQSGADYTHYVTRLAKKLPFIASRHVLLAKDLVTWQAMVGRHILEDIVGRVVQYVDEHYPVDKWHLGDLIAWVAQSALKYRPRICELSKCLEGPLKMIVCPKKLLPTLSHLVKLLYAARQ